ncbi:threonine-phosphate decarboxylase [Shimia sp. SDUM112013]|uniref:threonine-phosphate decarboxylase n=1 Tax=Shimia sp. SDUM112013 TaxID=3136160 RepID=UPI0032EC0D56
MTPAGKMTPRDHGGGLDAAMARWGGTRTDWIDLSTGINPDPYPIQDLPMQDWAALPDQAAQDALTDAARQFWNVPEDADILAAPGASALIACIPALAPVGAVDIPEPTYNEHAAAFLAQGWHRGEAQPAARVLVHPNNPTGDYWDKSDLTAPLTIIDESFCDVSPSRSLICQSNRQGRIVLKSFGKFWGLAGLRLGFAIGDPGLIARLRDLTGPWAVSGPALRIGATALKDMAWAQATRARLERDAQRLDALVQAKGANLVGGTPLFRLYDVDNAQAWQERLAQYHIWTRIFPYSDSYLRLGLPPAARWAQLEAAL